MPTLTKPFPHRWWWSPPWKVTRPWMPRVKMFREGGDEYCNPTVLVVLPMLGDVVIRYRPGPIRTEACAQCQDEMGPWDPVCLSCHHGPRCHPGLAMCFEGKNRCVADIGDCPVCGGMYCTDCEPDPEETCPTK